MSSSQGLEQLECNQSSLEIHFYIEILLVMYVNMDIFTKSHCYVHKHLCVLIHLEEILKENVENDH